MALLQNDNVVFVFDRVDAILTQVIKCRLIQMTGTGTAATRLPIYTDGKRLQHMVALKIRHNTTEG